MKKINFLLILLILSACTPQVTVTSEVTVTLPPPTETTIPIFTPTPKIDTFISEYGLEVLLGETLSDGSQLVTQIIPPEKYQVNETAIEKYLNYFDAERLGFDNGTTQWIKTVDGRVMLVNSSDASKVIAEYKTVNMTGLPGIVWNWENFIEDDGENVLLDVCPIWELKRKGGAPVDNDSVLDFESKLHSRESAMVYNGADMMYGTGEEKPLLSESGSILSQDGKSMVVYRQLPYTESEGFLATRDIDGNAIILYFENMVWGFYAD